MKDILVRLVAKDTFASEKLHKFCIPLLCRHGNVVCLCLYACSPFCAETWVVKNVLNALVANSPRKELV